MLENHAEESWFAVPDETILAWPDILVVVATEQRRLAAVAGNPGGDVADAAHCDPEQLNLVLGITCHAIYHAGQIQLIKRLHSGQQ